MSDIMLHTNFLIFLRIEVQAMVRRLGHSTPGTADVQAIERERNQLVALISQLREAQRAVNISECQGPYIDDNGQLHMWDGMVDDTIADSAPTSAPVSSSFVGPVPIEQEPIPLPSNGRISQAYNNLELSHRISLADLHLNRIRDLIAEKSFQYSHVIRVAPRKGVVVRSRASIKKLNGRISLQCQLYAHCRTQLIRLGADPILMSRLKVLTPEDVKASTAIINPNISGSTQLKLSWIWGTADAHRLGLAETVGPDAESPAALLECQYFDIWHNTLTNNILVRRVHWLRARAQLLRWKEEVTLTTYEMQWSVRYFVNKSRKWAVGEWGPSAGAVAYAKRKQEMWDRIAFMADSSFTILNIAYKSPL